MGTVPISRVLSYDYLVLVPAVAVLCNLAFVAFRRWRELLVFQVAGLVNLAAEVAMVGGGVRHLDTEDPLLRAMTLICLGWVTNGFLFALAFANVSQWLRRKGPLHYLVAVNAIFLIGLPLASVDYGLLDGSVRTWRAMSQGLLRLEPVAVFVLAAVVFWLGYRRLLWRLLLIGMLIDICFEARLFALGIRPVEQLDLLQAGTRVVFEMNLALLAGFLVLKGIFGLKDYRDDRLS
ncbi:hypothetical protein ACFL59_07135 [Planctomycetota bacterium]